MTAKELREKRRELVKPIDELRTAAKGRDFTAEEQTKWDDLVGKYDALSAEIGRAERDERADRIAAEQREPAESRPIRLPDAVGDPEGGPDGDSDDEDDRQDDRGHRQLRDALADVMRGSQRSRTRPAGSDGDLALRAWLRADTDSEPTEQEIRACRRLRFNPARRKIRLCLAPTQAHCAARRWRAARRDQRTERLTDDREFRASLSAVTGSGGEYLVPEGFVANLEQAMLAYGGMLEVAELMRTDTGQDLPWPTVDDTSNEGEQLGESASIGSSVAPTIGRILFGAYKYHSKVIKVPNELIDDSAFDVAGQVGTWLGERLGRITNRKCTTGTGAGTIRGITVAGTLGVTSASATAIGATEILDLIHSVDPAYRQNARFMLHDAVILHLLKLVGGDGQFLWQPSMQEGQPDRLHGYPVTVNQHMASTVATTQKTVLFGDLSKYKIRQVRGIRLVRLDERYADTDEVGFDAFLRQDGNLLDAGTHPVKYLQQT